MRGHERHLRGPKAVARCPYGRPHTATWFGRHFFKGDLIFLSSSSNDMLPLSTLPLTKEVGVALTFSTSWANVGRRRAQSKNKRTSR
jgi:hypothetical protein